MVQREKLEENKLLQERILAMMSTYKYDKVRELVNDLQGSSDSSTSLEEIHDACRALEHEGKIKLNKPAVQGSFFTYVIKNYYSTFGLWLSLIAISISLGTIYFVPDIEPFSIVRIITGSVAVFLIPGYGLIGLLFSRKDIPPIERIGLSLISSLVAVPILWLTLDWMNVWVEINSVIYVSVAGILVVFASTYRQFLIDKARGQLHESR